MSKLQRAFYQGLCCLLVVIPTMASATLSSPVTISREAQLTNRLQRLDLPLPTVATDAFTQRKIADYLGPGGRSTERMLGRANLYFPIFEYYLAKHCMPASLKYLAVAESMLVPGAVSSARAAGLWQLMPATAREMGLRVDGTIDERLDIHRSTEAAVLMLKGLHEEFADWNMVLAAYNAGGGRVRRAIRAAGSDTYDEVMAYLPGETQRYVAAYLAAAYAVNYYDDHGLTPRELPGTESVRVHRRMTLAKLARECNIRPATLRRINPMFVQAYIPASAAGYRLRVPSEQKHAVQQFLWGRPNLVELPGDENLEAAQSVATQQGFDPLARLFGVRAGHLRYTTPTWRARQLTEWMLLDNLDNYRAFASL
ncbi:hypothetical protein LEM8419_02311 [Neolewinella maritima]|uniref:Transglycosylase SLT domain-containing protein n=1 Tax=Neolewinella maritima TaxID=1383882 RepID=A0ABN8FA97_9BACT|nr:lytic transglycosylase domain-containing protein [Neolewinella maritima]CAH1001408.1 hypothetical protein LEM8419_02311 [Neolewinella maritima]